MSTQENWMTYVNVPAFPRKIRYGDTVTLAGSCFTDHIGQKLSRYKYNVIINPFGILYNPVSLAVSFERIAKQQFYTPSELVFDQGYWHSMDHHGTYSGKDPLEVCRKINLQMEKSHLHLQQGAFVFISPGTSNVFRYKPTSQIAGNCHKIPQLQFEPLSLSLEECKKAFLRIKEAINHLSPHAAIIWTVSPIRHIRDGLVESQRSKAVLLLACADMVDQDEHSAYFPAYEIMMDQLRDYRYYTKDMIHPSELAVDIIWDIFCETYVDEKDRQFHLPLEKIRRAMEHRLHFDDKEAIRDFAQHQLKQIDALSAQLPDLNWQPERQYFFHQLELD